VFEILKALEAYCITRRNETIELYKFFTRKQADGEAFDKYYADLRELVKPCELGNCEDKLLKTQIILGIVDKDLQAKLLREELSLEKTVEHCQIVEQSEINRKLIQEETKLVFNIGEEQQKGSNQFKKGSKSSFHRTTQHKQTGGKEDGKVSNNCHCKANNKSNFKEKTVKLINDCTRCGRSHKVNECSAYGKICGQCGLKNHFRIKCRKGEISGFKNQGQINNIESDDTLVSIDALEIMNTENEINNNKLWMGKIIINGVETDIKLDTGAELNVVSVKMIKKNEKY